MTSTLVWKTITVVNSQWCLTTVSSTDTARLQEMRWLMYLVRQVVTQSCTGPEPALGFSMMSVKRIMCQWTAHEHDKQWHDRIG